ncbi:3-oxoadipyl-CoA thiolase [Arenicella xantha]|uniref:Acetyl-CoA C-acetyltransferase n=1 Tax=Arenicella xantha TaxID=644221 RepID=A0A395JT90_9GAMM|nr:3-oxoadipyl-CoA thiolase [Arenicella xantha]RBP53552.1 acetyl-CoA C-acetyltransferase [Arenicella xantha]
MPKPATNNAYICDGIRTPIGRYGGALSSVRADDLAAIPIRELKARNPNLDWSVVDEVILGCANQAGEDNRNVARMASLLAGLDVAVAGVTVNRLCGSGMEAVGQAARALKLNEAEIIVAGGVESMSRSPLVMPKADTAFSRNAQIFDTTIGWRFINKALQAQYGTESMPETAENLAEKYHVSRADQDTFAAASQHKAGAAQACGFFADEIVPVEIVQRRGEPFKVEHDEHIRADTSVEKLAKLSTPFRVDGSVTAGNASGVNDGACALLLASDSGISKYGLAPRGRIVAMASVGVEPKFMGIGPVPATHKVLNIAGLSLADIDVIELNEAFAVQALSVLRGLEIADDDPRVNVNGGGIALGHPLGMSGARIVYTALRQLERTHGRYALCTMCVGVGQGLSMIIERCQ